MRKLTAIGSVFLVLLLAALSFYFANFWIAFLFPAITLSVIQIIAFSSIDNHGKDRIFAATDFIYYILIGAVVGLTSKYLPEFENIIRYDSRATYEQALAELPSTVAAQEEASRSSERFSQTLESIGADTVNACMMQWQLQDLRKGEDRSSTRLSPYPPGCEIPLGILDAATRQAGEASSLASKRKTLERIVSEGPEPPHAYASLPSENTIQFLLYKLFPSLVLCGVALKVGKTTHSLLKIPAS